MKKSTKEMLKLSAKEVFLSIVDLTAEVAGMNYYYRKGVEEYLLKREFEKKEIAERFKYLRRAGYIETFMDENNRCVEITPKGKEYLKKINYTELKITRSEKWDKKWRVVIFDIPEDHKDRRDMFREKLLNLGFELIQKSVYVYPFECTNEIAFLKECTLTTNNVIIMISDIIEGEEKILNRFMKKGVLNIKDLE